MYILIDESGSFAIPKKVDGPGISLVAALVVPEDTIRPLARTVSKLACDFGLRGAELKGRNLDETKFKYFVDALVELDVTLHVSCIDMALHQEALVKRHQSEQADKFLVGIERVQPGLKEDLHALAAAIRSLPMALYVQSILMSDVADMVFRAMTLYYCCRKPETLGSYRWRIDAKNPDQTTKYENLWLEIVMPTIQAISLNKPMSSFDEGNYEHLKRFELNFEKVPDYLAPAVKDPNRSMQSYDLRMVMRENVKFLPSDKYRCLQAIDVLSNGVRRAMMGRLGEKGWGDIGKLMVQPENGRPCMRCIALYELPSKDPASFPYNRVFRRFYRDTKQMLPKSFFR